MRTEVIILAQGSQRRLGMAHGYKQLLPLPVCGGMPILMRTLHQLSGYCDRDLNTTLVATDELMGAIPGGWGASVLSMIDHHEELRAPGNSSLKGIARYLELRGAGHAATRTVVLLGDVVYSWHCLNEIFSMSRTYGFVGTSDLSAGGGELWGVAWAREYENAMLRDLADALLRHPPFEDEYQPGQMRRWITGFKRGPIEDHVRSLRRTGHYADVDDYTRDIDLPEHLALLPKLSESAAADDHDNNAPWSTQ
jgi:hypothetical protein